MPDFVGRTMGALAYSCVFHILLLASIGLTAGIFYCSFWSTGVICVLARVVGLVYGSWYIWDFQTPLRGRPYKRWSTFFSNRLRMAALNYFSYRLLFDGNAKAKLECISGPKIYCCHPHGVQGSISALSFLVDRRIGGKLIAVATLNIQFYIPFWRELVLSYGMVGPGKEAILGSLKNRNEDVALVVGGARETALMFEHQTNVVLGRRTGVFKLALEHGIALVPVLNFGENEIYKQIILPHFFRTLQFKTLKSINMFPVVFYGKFLVFPRKVPVVTVIGEPIAVDKTDGANASAEQIEKLRKKYIAALTELHERHKNVINGRTYTLSIE